MTQYSQQVFLCGWAVVVTMLGSSSAMGGEAYYLVMFGSQRVPANPNYSHTWTTFVKATWPGDGPCPKDAAIEAHNISWLPANLIIRVSAPLPECGHNFGLHETIEFAQCTQQRISVWGPYCIDRELFEWARARKDHLESGQVMYKANDVGHRSVRVTNCIHAVSSVVEGPKLRVASPGWGESASYFVLKQFEPWIRSKEPVTWVGSALDLDRHALIYRDFTNPRSNAVFGPVFRLLGSERNLIATYGPPAR